VPIKYYAGIGHRKIPDKVYNQMINIARLMYDRQYHLRSGGAEGSDSAFELGAKDNTEIYLPWEGFRGRSRKNGFVVGTDLDNWEKAKYIASIHHPAWGSCDEAAQKFHGRNVYQILGFDLNTPVDVVICFAKPIGYNTVMGGTGTAVSIAHQYGVPVYNLWFDKDLEDLKTVLGVMNV